MIPLAHILRVSLYGLYGLWPLRGKTSPWSLLRVVSEVTYDVPMVVFAQPPLLMTNNVKISGHFRIVKGVLIPKI